MTQIPDKSDPDTPQQQAEYRARMRLEWHDLIEELITEGREQGKFDNLPGKGKPLNLPQNPYAPDQELAYALLKDNQLVPAWIMDRNRLLEQAKALRLDMERLWQRWKRQFDLEPASRDAISIRWYDQCQAWDKQIGELNKKIADFNLKRPSENLELIKLDLDWELSRLGAVRWLRVKDTEL